VIPDVVRAERSLFVPNAFQAILAISQLFMATRSAKLAPDLSGTPAMLGQNQR
jgi:hypothetical protein